MTSKEEQTLKEILVVAKELRAGVSEFKTQVTETVSELSSLVEKKHVPICLEKDILSTVQSSVAESIKTTLTGYNSPMTKLVTQVIESHSGELRCVIDEAFSEVIRTDDFKASLVSAFSHKISRTIISNNDGLFDKVSNELKQDATFKSKITLAVANVVEECLKKNN